MKIKFMLILPSDKICLYDCSEEMCESPFGGMEKMQIDTLHSKEYSETILSEVKQCVSGIEEYNYRGTMGRIAREVYQVKINGNSYEVAFVFDKRDENKVQIHIEIESPAIAAADFETGYNKTLETFKLALKERLKADWKQCTWLIDDQSEMLCSSLYHRFFRIENQVRAFANKVLILHLGSNWLEHPCLEKYRDSVLSMETSFKQIVSQFANINTALLSMTLETLSEVMLKATVYNDNTVLTSMDLSKLYQFLNKRNDDGAKEFVQRKREIKIRIWEDVFAQYFSDSELFKKQLSQFIKSRNHIAHNKLLTFSAFKQIYGELDDFETTIERAMISFEEQNASQEMLDTWMSEQEEAEYDKEYWRDRIFGETGVEIRNADEITKLFCETVARFCEGLSDKYHYNPCFEVLDADQPVRDGMAKVCTVVSNASEEKLDIIVSTSVDEDMDSSSYLNVEAKHGDNIIAAAECTYHNGEVHEGEEGLCEADSDSEYDDSQMHKFFNDVVSYIENELNPYLRELSSLEYECVKHGGTAPVADFACEECGNNGVSVSEDFLPIGKCCYCGWENEVHICELCGTIYEDMGGDQHICNGCMPKDD